jgi:hypothetical protein
LESSGKVKLHLLCLPDCVASCKNGVVWEEMQKQIKQSFNINESKRFALLIDDIDAFELIAPSPLAARQFFSTVLWNMSDQVILPNNYHFSRLIKM